MPDKYTCNSHQYERLLCTTLAETAIAGIIALYRGMNQFAVLKEQQKWIGYPIRAELQLLHNKSDYPGCGWIG